MRWVRCALVVVMTASVAFAQERPQCTESLLDTATKPHPAPNWDQIAKPDYTRVADQITFAHNLRLLISVLEKSLATLRSGASAATVADSPGVCLCNCSKSAGEWVDFLRDTVSTETQQAVQKTKDRYLADLQARLAKGQAALFPPPPATFRSELEGIIATACSTGTCDAIDKSPPATALYAEAVTAVQTELDRLFGPLKPDTLVQIAADVQALLDLAHEILAIVESNDRVTRLLEPATQQKIVDLFSRTKLVYDSIEAAVDAAAKLPPATPTDLQTLLRKNLESRFTNATAMWTNLQTAVQNSINNRVQAVRVAADELLKTATDGKALLDQFTAEISGGLLLSLTQVQGCYGVTTRGECTLTAFCDGTTSVDLFGSKDLSLPLWIPTEVFKDGKSALRWALQTVDWLDKAKRLLTENGVDSTAKMQELLTLLNNADALAKSLAEYVNTFTEGYHLGAYSQVRSDLHQCVGYAGHGVMAEVFSASGGEFRGGASYLSANLSEKHRAQLRTAGFSVYVNGRTLPLAPGVSLNSQIDGFRLWNRDFLFGNPKIPFNPTLDKAQLARVDAFNLVRCCEGPTDRNCTTCPINVLYTPYFKLQYGNELTWPRGPAWEKDEPLTAVFGAGLNLDLEMKTKKWNAPPIPLFPGATLKPWLELDAGVNWHYTVDDLRKTLVDKINLNLKNKPLGDDAFKRLFHPLQAPDVSEDVANGAHVNPRLGADLVLGFSLARWLTIGVTANLYVGVDVKAGGSGGVIDFNRALVDVLKQSNPPMGDCKAKIETTVERKCSNETFKPPDPCLGLTKDEKDRECPEEPKGGPYSKETYACAGNGLSCAGEKGYCADAKGTIVLHDVTREQCEAVEAAPARCVATYRSNPSEPGSGGGSVPRELASGVLAGTILPPDLRDSENARAQWEADQLPTKEQCESKGWCFNWGYAPGVNASPYSAVYIGTASSRENCPAAEYDTKQPILDNRCPIPGEPAKPLPAQFVRFTWVEATDASTDPAKAGRRFHPYQCVQTSRPVVKGFEGPDCNPIEYGYPSACPQSECMCEIAPNGDDPCGLGRKCVKGACVAKCDATTPCASTSLECRDNGCVMKNGVPFAEQVVWELKHAAQPQHVVATYGLNKLITSAVLGVGVRVGMEYRLFRKWRKQNLLDFTKAIPLVELPFVQHQLGLAAQYQDDCSPSVGQTENHQQSLVTRYGGGPARITPTSALLAWCKPAMEADAQNPPPFAEPESTIGGAVAEVVDFGKEIAVDFWARGQLCAGGTIWDQYFSAFETNQEEFWKKLQCKYDGRPLTCSGPGALQSTLVASLGCPLLTPWNAKLVSALQSQLGALTAATYLLPAPNAGFVDLEKVLRDPAGTFAKNNVKDVVLALQTQQGFSVERWLEAMNACVNDKTDGGWYDDGKFSMQLQLDELTPCGGACCEGGRCRDVASQADCRGIFRPGASCDEGACDDAPATEPPPRGSCMVFGKCQEVSSPTQCQGSLFRPGQRCGDPPAMCSQDSHCPTGTWCRRTERGDTECVPFRTAGTACGFFAPSWQQVRCAPGLVCTDFDPSVPDLGGKCRRACTSVPPALAAWWPLDEAAGPTAMDYLARLDGRHANQPTPVEGVAGRALSFDGVNDYLEIANAPDLNFGTGDFSFVSWIRTTATGTNVVLDKRQETGSLGYHVYLSNGLPGIQLGDGRLRSWSGTQRINDGQWHHVAVTVDRDRSDGIRFYVDGRPAGVADPTPGRGSITSTAPLRFALRTLTTFNTPWRGALDEPALFSRALSAAEVQRISDTGAAGICKCIGDRRALEAWWPLDETDFMPVTSAIDVVRLSVATMVNGPATVPGVAGGAFSFDGIDDYAEVASTDGLNLGTDDFSLVAWIRTTQATGTQSVLDKRAGAVGYHLFISNGRPGLQLADGAFANFGSARSIADGNWHLVAVTVDRDRADGIRFYVDGQWVAPAADPTARRRSLSNRSVLRMAKRTLTNDGLWRGALDEVAIHRRVLTASEVAALYRARQLGMCATSRPLVVR